MADEKSFGNSGDKSAVVRSGVKLNAYAIAYDKNDRYKKGMKTNIFIPLI